MAIARSTQNVHGDGHGSGLSPTCIRVNCVEGRESSSIAMGQENVIALLLQQQEEVLKEIRDQNKNLMLSTENKQEIARLVLLSLKKQRLHEQPVPGEPPHHQPSRQLTSTRTRTSAKRTASKRTRKKRSAIRSSQRSLHSSRDNNLAHKHQHQPTPVAMGSECLDYSSSSYRNINSNNNNSSSSRSPAGADEPSSFPQETPTSAHDDGELPTSTTVIRQRVEKQADQVEVSLEGLWLPSLTSSSGFWGPGTAAGRRRNTYEGDAATAGAGRWAESSTSATSYSAAMLALSSSPAGKNYNLPADGGRRHRVSSGRARPVTVDSQATRRHVLSSHHQRKHEEDAMPARSHLDDRRGPGTGEAEDNDRRGHKGMMRRTGDNGGGDDGRGTSILVEQPTRERTSGYETCGEGGNTMAGNISQDTVTMLKISHALVARAKACCGQGARSSTAKYISRENNVGLKLPLRGRASDSSSPTSGRHQGGCAEPSLTSSDGGGGAGEAEAILFASSPWPTRGGSLSASRPLDDVAEEEGNSRISPPVPADVARNMDQDGQTGDVAGIGGSLEHPAPEGAEFVEDGVDVALKHSERDRQRSSRGVAGERDAASGQECRESSREAPVQLVATGGTQALGPAATGAEAYSQDPASSEEKRASMASSTSSTSVGKGRRRGSASKAKASKRTGKGVSAGAGAAEDANPAKVDSEWENEIAKNILSLYQTKLKADLDAKKGAREHELVRKQRGYLTIEEEEDGILEQKLLQQQQYPNSTTKPSTAAAAPSTGNRSRGFNLAATTKEPTTPARTRGKSAAVSASSPSSRRPVTAATKPREVVVGRDFSLGRQPPPPPNAAASSPGAGDKQIGRDPAAAAGGAGANTGRGGPRGRTAISVPTRGGGEAVVVVPKRPRPIWFAGSGAVQAEWSALPGGARVVRDLEGLEEQGRYTKYVAVVEGLLTAHLRADDQQGPSELVKKMWRQLVATCIAFGVRSTENRRFERALELLKRAVVLLSRQALDKRSTQELQAFVDDAYGLYFLRRGKSSAALDYVQRAMKTHARMRDWGHVTKCHLHSSVVLSKLNRHDEALRCLGQVLSMVQEGKLDVGGNSPQKLCLVAICYHNMAVEQLILRHAGEACMSSQNARRLARLCLSYSNRWLHSFEGTHKLALAELARTLPAAGSGGGGGALGTAAAEKGGNGRRGDGGQGDEREQRDILKRLTEELFS